jgi:hypothetical protein
MVEGRRVEGEPAGTSSASRKINKNPFRHEQYQLCQSQHGTDAVEWQRAVSLVASDYRFPPRNSNVRGRPTIQDTDASQRCYGMNPSNSSNSNNLNYLVPERRDSNTYLDQLMSNAHGNGTARLYLARNNCNKPTGQQRPWQQQSNPNPISSQGRGNNMTDRHHGHVIWSRQC